MITISQNRIMTLLLLIIVLNSFLYAQHTPYWNHKVTMFNSLPNSSNEIVFLGDNLTDRCEWFELFSNTNVKNRGLSADNTSGVLDRLNEVTESNPDKIFIMIGVNDLRSNVSISKIKSNYELIISNIINESPQTKIFIQTLLPVNNLIGNSGTTNDRVIELNNELKNIDESENLTLIDLFNFFTDSSGNLDKAYTEDGLNINGLGYVVWKEAIDNFVNDNTDIQLINNSSIEISNYSLSSFPNPFNGQLSVIYYLPKKSSTQIIIYDVLGRIVNVSNTEVHSAGKNIYKWNSKNINSGTYIVVLYADGYVQSTNKVLLIK